MLHIDRKCLRRALLGKSQNPKGFYFYPPSEDVIITDPIVNTSQCETLFLKLSLHECDCVCLGALGRCILCIKLVAFDAIKVHVTINLAAESNTTKVGSDNLLSNSYLSHCLSFPCFLLLHESY